MSSSLNLSLNLNEFAREASSKQSWSFVDRRHLPSDDDISYGNGALPFEGEFNRHAHRNEAEDLEDVDFQLTCLTNQIQLSILKDEVDDGFEKIKSEMDSLNHDCDDLRAGHYDMMSEIEEVNCEVQSLQSTYKKLEEEVKGTKKKLGMIVRGASCLGVVVVGLVVYLVFP